MSSRLADRLSLARHRRFVGRAHERALFQAAIATTDTPYCLLYVYGPGGVGKTTLLHEFTMLCEQAGIPAYSVDGRNIEPTPEGLLDALRRVLGLAPGHSPVEALLHHTGRQVILIDTYELLTPLDGWIRDTFLPQLPEQALVVLAGRQPPTLAWRADSGWQHLIQTMPLRNLSPEESRAYLTKREVPATQHAAVLAFTHGHPLALSLVADVFAQRRNIEFHPQATPDMVKTLLEQFVQKVPGPAHRAALEACALVRLTTETLLGELLAIPDAHDLFAWLRDLSFLESGPYGVFPHDLAREALAADVRWRNPDWYAELHHRARHYYATRLQQTHGQEQQRILFDYVYLHRDNPVMRPFFEWQERGGMVVDAATEHDLPLLLDMVAKHEGEEAACLLARWFARQPRGVLVPRESQRQPAGLLVVVALQETDDEDREADPAVRAAWHYLQRHAPLRPGEGATLFRFWLAGDTYQQVSATQSLLFVTVAQHYLTTPGLAFSFFPCADPDFWAPMFAYIDLHRLPEADFTTGERRFAVYGHDWRVTPPLAWLALLAEREIASEPQSVQPSAAASPLVVLSLPDFVVHVRDALRDVSRPAALLGNPLLRSRLVVERAGTRSTEGERVATLRALLQEAAGLLRATPREAKLYRALHHTYFQPASTQEQAAELLDLPFSTFRRHLRAGVRRVVETLWQWEVGGDK